MSHYLLVNNFTPFFNDSSDTMGNKGAFITLKGGDLTPNFKSYEAVVSVCIFCNRSLPSCNIFMLLFASEISSRSHSN